MRNNYLKDIQTLVVCEYMATKHFLIGFWENYTDHEYLLSRGTTNSREAARAKQAFEDAKGITFEEIKSDHVADFSLCLRAAMRKLYIDARDFRDNPYICLNYLRKVVMMRKMLNEASPDLEVYSTKYLINAH